MSAKPRAKPPRREARKAPDFEREVGELAARMARSPSRWALRKARRRFERLYLLYAIEKAGSHRRAARMLGISYSSLKEKMRDDWLKT